MVVVGAADDDSEVVWEIMVVLELADVGEVLAVVVGIADPEPLVIGPCRTAITDVTKTATAI